MRHYRDSNDGEVQNASTAHFYEIIYYQKVYGDYKEGEIPIYFMLFRSKYELIEIRYSGNRTPGEIIENVEKLYNKE